MKDRHPVNLANPVILANRFREVRHDYRIYKINILDF